MERDHFDTITDSSVSAYNLRCGGCPLATTCEDADAYLLLCVRRCLGGRVTSLCPAWWAGIEALVWTRIAGIVVDRIQAARGCRPMRWTLLFPDNAGSSVGALHRPLGTVWTIATSCQCPLLVLLRFEEKSHGCCLQRGRKMLDAT